MGFSLGAHTVHTDQGTLFGTGEFLDLSAVKFHSASQPKLKLDVNYVSHHVSPILS